MKKFLTLAFILAAGLAHASGDLAVPKGKSAMAKSPPPVAQLGEPRDSCLAREKAKCEAANWTKLGKRACIRWKSRACR